VRGGNQGVEGPGRHRSPTCARSPVRRGKTYPRTCPRRRHPSSSTGSRTAAHACRPS